MAIFPNLAAPVTNALGQVRADAAAQGGGGPITNPDGSVTTTNPDGTQFTKFPDGTVQTGPYVPTQSGRALADTRATQQSLQNQFAAMAAKGSGAVAPAVTAPVLDQSAANQSRGLQMGGAGVQASAIPVIGSGLNTEQAAGGVQLSGLTDQGAARGSLGAAGQSYQDVLSGAAPSVAQLQGEQQAGQNEAAQFGAAAGATGANRGLALRTAMNNSGGLNAQQAAQSAILRANEQNAARSGLTSVGQAQSGVGTAVTGTGTAVGNTGANIVAGGNTLAGVGSGLAATGTAARGQDLTAASTNAANNLAAQTTNSGANVTTTGQDLAYRTGMAGNANAAGGNAVTSATSAETAQENVDKSRGTADRNAAQADPYGAHGELPAGATTTPAPIQRNGPTPSSEEVKTDPKPTTSAEVSALFSALNGANAAINRPPTAVTPAGSQIARDTSPPAWQKDLTMGLGAAAAAAPLIALSSKEVKRDVAPSGESARDTFSKIVPMKWAYDPAKMAARGLPEPQTEGTEHLGPIAEQVEATGPLGKGMITQVNGTKAIDIQMAVPAMMAAIADLEKRVGKAKGAPARG